MRQFEHIYEAQKVAIYSFVLSILRIDSEAQEVTQETFLALYKEMQKAAMPEEKYRPWLFKVAKNKALNTRRDRREEPASKKPEELPAHHTPEILLSVEQEKALVARALDSMRTREATLLQLYSSGLPYSEIAEVMGLERNTIGKALLRAKQSFRGYYEALLRNVSPS